MPAVAASVPPAVAASVPPAVEGSVAPDLARRLEEALGMGFLPTVFILLAGQERYLRAATEAFLAQPLDAMEEHAQAIRLLGADAAARLMQRPWQLDASAREIGSLIDAYNVVNPPSLLFTLFLLPAPTRSFRIMERPLPPRPTRSDRRALLADIDACHGSFKLPGFWRELAAAWPEHAASAWSLVRALPEQAGFAHACEAVRSLAVEMVGEGAPAPAALGCTAAEAASIASILSFYAIVIPTMVIEIECLRHALALGMGPVYGGPER